MLGCHFSGGQWCRPGYRLLRRQQKLTTPSDNNWASSHQAYPLACTLIDLADLRQAAAGFELIRMRSVVQVHLGPPHKLPAQTLGRHTSHALKTEPLPLPGYPLPRPNRPPRPTNPTAGNTVREIDPVRPAAAMTVGVCTWLQDEEAGCSTKVHPWGPSGQQARRSRPTTSNPPGPADLRQRPIMTLLVPAGGRARLHVRMRVNGGGGPDGVSGADEARSRSVGLA
jgi:hypothetical protein